MLYRIWGRYAFGLHKSGDLCHKTGYFPFAQIDFGFVQIDHFLKNTPSQPSDLLSRAPYTNLKYKPVIYTRKGAIASYYPLHLRRMGVSSTSAVEGADGITEHGTWCYLPQLGAHFGSGSMVSDRGNSPQPEDLHRMLSVLEAAPARTSLAPCSSVLPIAPMNEMNESPETGSPMDAAYDYS